MLDTWVYDVMFPDGVIRQYSTNSIADNMYSQVDEKEDVMALLDRLIDHRSNESAIWISDFNSKTRFTTMGFTLTFPGRTA